MKIDSSVISMSGSSSSIEAHSMQESLNYWRGNQRPTSGGTAQSPVSPPAQLDVLTLSEEGKAMFSKSQYQTEAVQSTTESDSKIPDKDEQKIKLLEAFLELWTGKKVKIRILDKIKLDPEKHRQEPAPTAQRLGWGLEYNYHESHYESQKMSFSSEGTVKTADGREINFSLDLSMSREFTSRKDITVKAGDALIDPLVINFDSAAAKLTDKKFSFDIDSDGTSDQISFLTRGSGFLALDSNSDGIINNGRELFGPNTGNGFSELAQYDSDGNNWIDENDPIFDKLRIWTKDDDGTDRLFAIGEKGIGAIYLGNVDTGFILKDTANTTLGEIRKTGIFLKENGTAGTINHIDLAV